MKTKRHSIIVAGKLVQDHEYIYPYYRLKEAEFEVDVAVRGKETVYGSMGCRIEPTHDFPELDAANYNLLVIPGGAKAMEYMRQDHELLNFISKYYDGGGTIACICHGAQLLISAGLVTGKRISGYYSIEDDIRNAGGEFVNAPSVVDDRIVTSPHYKYLGDWMRATLGEIDARQTDDLT
ncbi:DJ-1/PfpI family protein [Comamonas squillarum]|uniref:DJ-1/PfpI family protein n=1 Tax=Comamonas squillarum TaxID=2977320 RepID=A0ABY6A3Y6_9BURK|nr:DJ-1/PfpI family protein [Comamonas sp. PR12]UXC19635.1 DJ-1/PfpI family protein [Comamonas sp. PR12]